MSSKARKIKTYFPPKDGQGYFHRDHHSKRKKVSPLRSKLEKIKIKELENEIN